MLSERFSLFYTGYALSLPQTYDSLHGLNQNYHSDKRLSASLQNRLASRLEELSHQRETVIAVAHSVAKDLRLAIKPYQPDQDYLDWMEMYISRVEDRYPMNQIGYYYFYYARMVTSLLGNICLAVTRFMLFIEVKEEPLLHKGADHLRDCEFIVFRLIAAAALVSSEHGHRYFNLYYKDLSQRYESIMATSWHTLTPEQMEQEVVAIHKFEEFAKQGFQQCFKILNDLMK